MAFEISKYARALPSLLELKERGKGPGLFSEQVVGTVDLTTLYLLQNRETLLTNVNNAPVLGSNLFATNAVVPPGEIWYIWEYFVGTSTGATQTITMQPAVNFDGQATPPLAPAVAVPISAAGYVASTHPFWATPGSTLGFLASGIANAPGIQGGLVVTKLRL